MQPTLLDYAETWAEMRDEDRIAAFEFTLPELRRFPEVLYLAPSPAETFKALISAIVERYPAYLPYGGAFSIQSLAPQPRP